MGFKKYVQSYDFYVIKRWQNIEDNLIIIVNVWVLH